MSNLRTALIAWQKGNSFCTQPGFQQHPLCKTIPKARVHTPLFLQDASCLPGGFICLFLLLSSLSGFFSQRCFLLLCDFFSSFPF